MYRQLLRKDAGKSLKLPPQKAESNVSQKERELQELQNALDLLKELGVREDQKVQKIKVIGNLP